MTNIKYWAKILNKLDSTYANLPINTIDLQKLIQLDLK